MTRHLDSAPRPRDLRSRWTRAFAVLLFLFVLTGAATFVLIPRLVDNFSSAAVQLDHEASYNANLADLIGVHQALVHEMLDGAQLSQADFLAGQARIQSEFARGHDVLQTPAQLAILASAEREWTSSLTSAGYWDAAPLRSGRAPAAAHGPLSAGTARSAARLVALDAESRQLLRARLHDAHSLSALTLILLALAYLVALSVTVGLVRQLFKDVLRPVAELRESVARIHDGDLQHRVAIDGSRRANELTDLAESFNAMAASVSATHETLDYRARHDALTALPNRQAFEEHLDELLAETGARRSTDLSVLFVDVDDFKTVNDSLGHAAGDQLLVEIADRLRRATRPGDFVARLGGDEFAVVIVASSSGELVGAAADRLLTAVARPLLIAGTQVQVSVSVGIATSGPEMTSARDLVSRADYAMYTAKRSGKGRYDIFDQHGYGDPLPGAARTAPPAA